MHSLLLGDIFGNAVRFESKAAFVSAGVSVTYGQLKERICSFAAFLKSLGLEKGDRIALSAKKEPEYVFLYFAAHFLGVANVVIDAESNQEKVDYIINLTKPKFLFGFEWGNVRSFSYKEMEIASSGDVSLPEGVCPEDTADIVFTTGTTGVPKGVCLSHFNLYSSASNINGFIGNTSEDIEILALPLCHSFGLGRLRCTLVKGGTIILLGSFANIKQFFSAIENYKATGFAMVPSAWAYIRKFSGLKIGQYSSQIKYIEIGSAAMPLESKKELCNVFPETRICMHYGLTEASRAAFMEFHSNIDNLETIGKPVCGCVDIKIMDSEGRQVPDGQQGEICIKGNMVTRSYYLEKENQNAFFGDYFRTGDLGVKKADGNFCLLSRIKEMINVAGKKVSPAEIEEAIISIGVEDCICVGIKDPAGVLGEVPKVYILKGTPLSFDQIRKALASKLEKWKLPVEYEWIDIIPKTSSGKKQRLSLKQ